MCLPCGTQQCYPVRWRFDHNHGVVHEDAKANADEGALYWPADDIVLCALNACWPTHGGLIDALTCGLLPRPLQPSYKVPSPPKALPFML